MLKILFSGGQSCDTLHLGYELKQKLLYFIDSSGPDNGASSVPLLNTLAVPLQLSEK